VVDGKIELKQNKRKKKAKFAEKSLEEIKEVSDEMEFEDPIIDE